MSTFSARPSDAASVATSVAVPPATGIAEPSPLTVSAGPPSIPLYVASAIVQVAGMTAVAYQVGDAGFTTFTIGLTLLGTTVSFFLRRGGATPRLLKLGVMFLAVIFAFSFRRAGIFEMLIPPDSNTSQEMVLDSSLAFTAAFGSFLLLNDIMVVFTCVWTIAIIGLTGTININRELPICFAVFLLAASFLLVHQSALAFTQENSLGGTVGGTGGMADPAGNRGVTSGAISSVPTAPASRRRYWRLVRTHGLMALAAWATAIILGSLIAIPVQMVGRNMSLATIIQNLRVPAGAASHSGGGAHLTFNNPGAFPVGLGPVDDDPTERLAVLSAKPHYWRGRTYDYYNGHGWSNAMGSGQSSERGWPPRFFDPTAERVTPRSLVTDEHGFFTFDIRAEPDTTGTPQLRKKTERIENHFEQAGSLAGPLFNAPEPILVRAPVEVLGVHRDGTIAAGSTGDQSQYDIVSDVSVAHPSDLRRSSLDYPKAIRSEYLTVDYTKRGSAETKVLVDEALANVPKNPYDRAGAIKRFIANRCTYSREALAVPPERDSVDFFMNESHEGYCDLYATAMVVLCRYAGIPARVATGFAPGTPDPTAAPTPGEKRTRYVLHGDDLHAWAEVYFTDYGWIVFDATEDTGGVYVAPKTPEPKPKDNDWRRLFTKQNLPYLLMGLGGLAGLYALVNEVVTRLRNRTGDKPWYSALFGVDRRRSRSENEATALYHQAVRYVGRRGGVPRAASTAPGEYLTFVRDRLGEPVAAALQTITDIGQRALYADASLLTDARDLAQARDAFRRLKVAIRDYRREQKHAR